MVEVEIRRKREAEEDADGGTEAKKARSATAENEIGEDVMAWLVSNENCEFAAVELRELPEEEEEPSSMAGNDVCASKVEINDSTAWCRSFRVKFIDDPYATSAVFQSSSGYITINGNEESCGSSFSDSDASVMASVDTRGLFGITGYFSGNSEPVTGVRAEEGGGSWDLSDAEALGWVSDNDDFEISNARELDGCYAVDRHNDLVTKLPVFDH